MENGNDYSHQKWNFRGNEELKTASISVRGVLNTLAKNLNSDDPRPTIMLGRGDPTEFAAFRTAPPAADALSDALLSVLARPGANILLPKPGYPQYEARASFDHLEVRHFDLIPEKGWEVDLDSVEALADNNTAAIVVINPSNPCGNVFTYQHLEKIAETAKKLGIFVISDEVYGGLAFGSNPFVPMGKFSSIVPVLTLGSISKTWIVPGWRLGWIVKSDPNGILEKTGIVDSIKNYLDITCDPATFVQVKLDLSALEGIDDDVQFCLELSKEESVIVLPGVTVGLKNWLRITFAVELEVLKEGLQRIKAFSQRHAKKQLGDDELISM
ncbi:hypothetical protein ACLB2K_059551 [Fragaria x ananassa]